MGSPRVLTPGQIYLASFADAPGDSTPNSNPWPPGSLSASPPPLLDRRETGPQREETSNSTRLLAKKEQLQSHIGRSATEPDKVGQSCLLHNSDDS